MAFFNNDLYNVNVDGVACAEGYDVDFGGLSRIVEETAADQLEIVKAMHKVDMMEIGAAYKVRSLRESSADDADIEEIDDELETAKEAALKDIFATIKEKIKAFFSKVFGFIKDLFDKLVTFKKSNKAFALKYRPVIDEYSDYIGTVEYKGYDYKVADISATYEDMSSKSEQLEAHLDKQFVAILAGLRDVVRDGGQTNAAGIVRDRINDLNEMNESPLMKVTPEMVSKGFSGEITSMKYNADAISKQLEILQDLDIKQLKKMEAKAKKTYANAEKKVKEIEAEFKKTTNFNTDTAKNICISAAQKTSSCITKLGTWDLKIIAAYRTVVVNYSNQIKHVTIKAISQAKENKAKQEKKD